MRRIHKIIVGLLVAGVLTMGIGSGIAFAEYSSFEYGGDIVMEGSKSFTRTVEYKVPVQEDRKEVGMDVYYDYRIVEDADVPKDTVRFTVHYMADDENIMPEIENWTVEENEERCAYIYLDSAYKYNDFREIMRLKDAVLDDLQNRRLSNYQLDGVEKVEIHVNPEADFTMCIEGMY